MLRITLLGIGKNKDRFIAEGCSHYIKLLSRYARVEQVYRAGPKISSSLSPQEVRSLEGEVLLKQMSQDFTIALDLTGSTFSSESFASILEKWQIKSQGRMTFVIGGAYGLHDSVLDVAAERLSLSPLTMSHQLVRLVLLEQLYRAFSILNGTPYHK